MFKFSVVFLFLLHQILGNKCMFRLRWQLYIHQRRSVCVCSNMASIMQQTKTIIPNRRSEINWQKSQRKSAQFSHKTVMSSESDISMDYQ